MSKAELIESIRELNFTASSEFLSQFTPDQLQQYLEHLLELNMSQLTAVGTADTVN